MSIIELALIGVGLSMDACAVSICKGLNMPNAKKKDAAIIAIFFGGFQALMPLIGWLIGKQFAEYIESYDHWIAFVLLLIIGGKMIKDAFSKDEDDSGSAEKLNYKELLVMAVATSIDALAIGISFAFLKVSIVPAVLLIGCITFALAFAGVQIGRFFGAKFKSKAQIAGGIILILIGTKILLEHLGVISF